MQQATGTILVVDDDEQLLKRCARLLRAMGYQVLTASDGRSAVEAVRQHRDRLSVVILDMTMPEMSGAATLICSQPLLARLVAPRARTVIEDDEDLARLVTLHDGEQELVELWRLNTSANW